MTTSISALFPEFDGTLPLPLQVAQQWHFPLAYHEADGKLWYAIPDWIKGLVQKEDVRALWTRMLPQLVLSIYQLPHTAPNGKTYPLEYTDDKGLYLIAQHLRSTRDRPLVKKVKEFLAKSGAFVDLARRTSPTLDPDEALNAVIEEYRRRGKSDEWIDARLTGIMKRHQFTAALRYAISNIEQNHYAQATNELYLGLWHRTAETLRTELNLTRKDNLRDHQPALGLMYQGIAEQVAAHHLKNRHELTIVEGLRIIHEVASIIGRQAQETSRLLRMDLATGKRLLRA